MGQRLLEAAQHRQGGRRIPVCLGAIGLGLEGLLIFQEGFLELAAAAKEIAQVLMHVRQVGVDFQRTPKLRQGFGELTMVGQQDTRLLCPAA